MSGDRLVVLTPSGDRLTAFRYCVDYMNRQTRKPDLWIITDDGKEDNYSEVLGSIKVPYTVLELPPMSENSLVRNVSAGLELITNSDDRLVFMEDDDWYPSDYLEVCYDALNSLDAVGAWHKKYYNVGSRMYREYRNHRQRCLHSLGITRSALKVMREAAKIVPNYSLDAQFCNMWNEKNKAWFDSDSGVPVHIVGFGRGRAGCTGAHNVKYSPNPGGRWKPDPSGHKLRQWIGADVNRYFLE